MATIMDDRDLMTRKDLDNIKSICSQRGTEIALMRQDVTNIKDTVEKLDKKFDSFENKFDDKFKGKADKWVEKVLIWGGAIVGAAIITALMSLILK